MRRFISVFIVFALILTFTGCANNNGNNFATNSENNSVTNSSNNLGTNNVNDDVMFGGVLCPSCDYMNRIENIFCSQCGYKLKESQGDFIGSDNTDNGSVESPVQNYSILEYFLNASDEPLIIYEVNEIAKDTKVKSAYVVKNGQCRLYECSTTLGELSNMTNSQVLDMLEKYYQEGLYDAVFNVWRFENNTMSAIREGKVKLYLPRSYDITGCLFTDSTGNSVVGELLFFPVAGVAGTPYIIEYPQYTEATYLFMNYYGTRPDNNSHREIKFDVEYFNTGYGTKSDVNEINNIYYFMNSSMKSGTVYNSQYYALDSIGGQWSENSNMLCFRVDDPDKFNLYFDTLSSSDVMYIDPTESDVRQISNNYYNAYYNSFEKLEYELLEQQLLPGLL